MAQDTSSSKYVVSLEESIVTYIISIKPINSVRFDNEELKELKIKLKEYLKEYPIYCDIKTTSTEITYMIRGKQPYVDRALSDIDNWLKTKDYSYNITL